MRGGSSVADSPSLVVGGGRPRYRRAMSLSDLSAEEDLVLLGLMRAVVRADGEYSAAEQKAMEALRDEMGQERFDAAVEAAKARFTSLASLKEHAASIERADAQSAIFNRLVSVAASDGVRDEEERPLRWLARTWPNASLKA